MSFVAEIATQLTGIDSGANEMFVTTYLTAAGGTITPEFEAVCAYWNKLTEGQQGKIIKELCMDTGDCMVDDRFEIPTYISNAIKRNVELIRKMLN